MATVLTDATVRQWKPDPTKALEIADAGCPGLYLVIQKSGTKAWALRYRFHGRPRKYTIGKYPAFPLAAAHKEASKALQAIAAGADPAGEKALNKLRARTGEGTFAAVVREFLAEYAKPKNRTWKDTAATFGLKPDKTRQKDRDDPATFAVDKDSLADVWGHRPVESITREEVKAKLKAISRGTAIAGNRTLAQLRKFYNWCIAEGYTEVNPCDKLSKPQQEVSRNRWLKNDDEFRAVWLAAGELGHPFAPIYQLLILTGARREEVGGMRWSELDLTMNTWTIPPERSKTGEEHTLPLSAPALAILGTLHRVGRSDLIFTRSGDTAPSGWSRAKSRLDKKAVARLRKIVAERGGDPEEVRIAPWRTHDLRRTMASRMGDLDILPHVVEAILNHVGGFRSGVAGTYNRNSYQRPMRVALDLWAREVERLADGEVAPSNVVPIGGRVA